MISSRVAAHPDGLDARHCIKGFLPQADGTCGRSSSTSVLGDVMGALRPLLPVWAGTPWRPTVDPPAYDADHSRRVKSHEDE